MTGLLDELDTFVDSEPVNWHSPVRPRQRLADLDRDAEKAADPAPEDEPRALRVPRSDPPPSEREREPEPQLSRRGIAPPLSRAMPLPLDEADDEDTKTRRDTFAARLDEHLSKPRAPDEDPLAKPADGSQRRRHRADRPDPTFADSPSPSGADETSLGARKTSSKLPPAPPPLDLEEVGETDPTDDEDALASGLLAGEADPGPLGDAEADDSNAEPADALDWEFNNAFSAIVNVRNGPEGTARRASVPPPTNERAVAPVGTSAPVVSTKSLKQVKRFNFERQPDPETDVPSVPSETDEIIAAMYYPAAQDAFDEAHEHGDALADRDGEADHGLDDRDFEFGDGDAGQLPPSLSGDQTGRQRRAAAPAAAIAAGVVALAVVGVVVVVGLNMFGGSANGDGGPPIIRADAADVKVRADTSAVQAEPDIAERAALTADDTLVLPDRVNLDQVAGARADTGVDPITIRPVRTVVVRPDGTIVRAGAAAAELGEQVPGVGASPREEPFDVASVRGNTVNDATINGTTGNGPAFATQPAGVERIVDNVPNGLASQTAPVAQTDTLPSAPRETAALAPSVSDPFDTPGASQTAPVTTSSGIVPLPPGKPAAPPRSQRASSDNGPLNLASQRSGDTASPPAVAAPPPSASTGTGASPWGVQVSSQRSRGDAERSFAALQQRYPSLFGSVDPLILEAEVPGRGRFYRVRIAADSRGEAASLCQRIKNAGADCFIGRN